MRTSIDCMPCFVRQAMEAARHATKDPVVHEQVVREVLTLASHMDMSQSPPAIGQRIHRWVRTLSGDPDPYRQAKETFNGIALALYPGLRERINRADNPLETAIRLAIAGNIIDFGVFGSVESKQLEQTIEECLIAEFDTTDIEIFKSAVNDAASILYLADNAGEIVFDRLLIEQLPMEKITVAVKGSPVINDATMADAEAVGLPSMVKVIDNDSDAPGTILENCSGYFQERFEKADLIIAKGQGNYETLSDIDRDIFFILKAKCPVIARDIGCEVGQMIFQKTKAFTGKIENAGI